MTGASSGIGRETANAFAGEGARVALTARNAGALSAARDAIRNKGGIAEAFPFDLLNLGGIPALVEEVHGRFGDSVDVLVNCAGTAVSGFVEDVPLDAYDFNLRLNFFAPLALIKAVIPGMKKKGRGQIINISSGVGKRGLPCVSPYCVSKSALNALTESLRVELAAYRIDVVLVLPGLTETGFSEKAGHYGDCMERFDTGKMTSPKEVARKIISASRKAKREVILSLRTRAACHLNYWAPRLFDYILGRRMR